MRWVKWTFHSFIFSPSFLYSNFGSLPACLISCEIKLFMALNMMKKSGQNLTRNEIFGGCFWPRWLWKWVPQPILSQIWVDRDYLVSRPCYFYYKDYHWGCEMKWFMIREMIIRHELWSNKDHPTELVLWLLFFLAFILIISTRHYVTKCSVSVQFSCILEKTG